MNTYDPADDIVYVHLARDDDENRAPRARGRTCTRLPAGYANGSPRTSLRRRGMPPWTGALRSTSSSVAAAGRLPAEVMTRIPDRS